MKKQTHSVGWNVAKLLTNKVRIHKTLNVVLSIVVAALVLFLIVLFCFSGGK